MKKIAILFTLMMVLGSCTATKTVRASKKVIKGNWVLNTITYNQAGKYNVTLLNDASKECFEGSSWQFIPNNNTGIYSLSKTNCPLDERYFIFTIQEIDPNTGLYDFLLKPTNEKKKSEINNSGFRLQLTHISGETMQWQQTVYLEGKPFKINMNFSKTQN